MIVLKGTALDVDGGKIKGVYHSEFLSYDKNNGLYIMRLHAKCREEIPDSSIDVAMNVKELTVLSDTNHIKEAYDFAIKVSEGYKPFFITLYIDNESKPNLEVAGCIVDMESYVELDNGCYTHDTGAISKVYWCRIHDIFGLKEGEEIYDLIGGKEYVLTDMQALFSSISDTNKTHDVDVLNCKQTDDTPGAAVSSTWNDYGKYVYSTSTVFTTGERIWESMLVKGPCGTLVFSEKFIKDILNAKDITIEMERKDGYEITDDRGSIMTKCEYRMLPKDITEDTLYLNKLFDDSKPEMLTVDNICRTNKSVRIIIY